ncbi:hypothetical protein IF2G_06122 [Cordyceps javanica]|nr:hypothetical protein IF2G_06122 [Cordyceps javanica]
MKQKLTSALQEFEKMLTQNLWQTACNIGRGRGRAAYRVPRGGFDDMCVRAPSGQDSQLSAAKKSFPELQTRPCPPAYAVGQLLQTGACEGTCCYGVLVTIARARPTPFPGRKANQPAIFTARNHKQQTPTVTRTSCLGVGGWSSKKRQLLLPSKRGGEADRSGSWNRVAIRAMIREAGKPRIGEISTGLSNQFDWLNNGTNKSFQHKYNTLRVLFITLDWNHVSHQSFCPGLGRAGWSEDAPIVPLVRDWRHDQRLITFSVAMFLYGIDYAGAFTIKNTIQSLSDCAYPAASMSVSIGSGAWILQLRNAAFKKTGHGLLPQ